MPVLSIDIQDTSGTKVGSGPIRTAANVKTTERLSKAGTFSFEMPIGDTKTQLIAAKRIAQPRTLRNGVLTALPAGIVDSITVRGRGGELPILAVSGDDIMSELANRCVLTLDLSGGTGLPVTTAAALTAVSAYLPAGWTIDSTTYQSTGTTTNASLSVTGVTNIGNFTLFGAVRGTGIPTGTTVAGISGTTLTLSAPATASGTVTLSGSTVYHQFGNETTLAALVWIAGAVGEQFRLGTGRQIVWLYRQQPSSGLRAIQRGDPVALAGNPGVLLIDTLEEVADTHNTITRVYPYGAGNAAARVTLAHATWTPPTGYTLGSEVVSGTTLYYIKYDSTDATNRIDSVSTYTAIAEIGTTATDQTSASNQLAVTAFEDLRRRVVAVKTYRMTVTKQQAALRAGDTLRVVYRATIDGYVATNINAVLVVLEVATSYDDGGIPTLTLTVATVDLWPKTASGVTQGVVANASAAAGVPQKASRSLTADTAAAVTVLDGGAGAYINAAVSVANATWTSVGINTSRWDASPVYWTGSSAMVAPVAGTYLITGGLSFANNTTGNRGIRFRLNAATVIAQTVVAAAGGTDTTDLTISTVYQLAAGDAIRLQAWQTSTAALNVLATANYANEIRMVRLS